MPSLTRKLAAALTLGALFLAGCGAAPADTAEAPAAPAVVKIGVIAPLSGDAAAYSTEMQAVIQNRLAKINTPTAATKVEVVYEDGKCEGASAVAAFHKLVDFDGVRLFLGGVCSSETLAVAPLLQQAGAVAVSALSSNPAIAGVSPAQFSLSYRDDDIGKGLATELGKHTKVAIISEQIDYAQGIHDATVANLKKLAPNTQIVADEVFPTGETNFRNLLAKVLAAKPEAVLFDPNVGKNAANLLRQAAELKWNGIKFYSNAAYLAADVGLAGVPNTFSNGMVLIDAPQIDTPELAALQAEIKAAGGSTENLGAYYTASTADGIDLLAKLAIEFHGDAAQIQTALATSTFDGFIGKGLKFGGEAFVQGVGVGKYVLTDGKAVYQK